MVAEEAQSFSDRLASVSAATGSLLCVGLDPDGFDTVDAAAHSCHVLLEETLEWACAVKANLAFFEQYGSQGYALLETLRAEVPADRLLILDGKRGDVASTSAAYARALFDVLGADAVTVNPLLGGDSVAPFLAHTGRGVLVLARTSNPGAHDFLDRDDDVPLYLRIVDEAAAWDAGTGAVGFVVGATAPASVAAVRRRAPAAPLLLPGVGAQEGPLEEAVAAGLDSRGAGLLVAVSRGIALAPRGPAAAARELHERIATVRAGVHP